MTHCEECHDPYRLHYPVIEDLAAPATRHDAACPVCWTNKAVLDLSTGIFQPCATCQREGYKVTRSVWRWLRNAKTGR